ncbi:MAG: MotA/TolQ/ExbB proton channel family protein [Deltaproteobacteria bacterium]|nr:MotA/TolQ/ExbB proton channel family protein [Deltaproteobacteria bacterium]
MSITANLTWLIAQAGEAAATMTPAPTPAPTVVPTPETIEFARGSLEQVLLGISAQAATSILYLLFFLSILSLAIAVEKYLQYRKENPLGDDFKAEFVKRMDSGDVAGSKKLIEGVPGIKAALLREGLANFHEGPAVLKELLDGRGLLERNRLDKHLIILGTVGNNAPFIGLLGTVMGIIRAFADLAQATTQGPQVVMAGISEALVATAVGLFVAIPAVVFFNYFKSRMKRIVDDAYATSNILIAFASKASASKAASSS